MKKSYNLLAFAFILLNSSPVAIAAEEDCLALPMPNGFERFFNTQKKKNQDACFARNEARTNQNIINVTSKNQKLVDDVRESCINAIRRISTAPSTISFDYVQNYDLLTGIKALGVGSTDSGYYAIVSGLELNGVFNITCFMGKDFNITDIRRNY